MDNAYSSLEKDIKDTKKNNFVSPLKVRAGSDKKHKTTKETNLSVKNNKFIMKPNTDSRASYKSNKDLININVGNNNIAIHNTRDNSVGTSSHSSNNIVSASSLAKESSKILNTKNSYILKKK